MLKSLLTAAALVFTPMLANAQAVTPLAEMPAGVYELDDTHASLTWKVNHLGLSNYTARFTKLDAELNFDPKDPTKSTLTASVDPTSIKTDFPKPEEKNFDEKLIKGEEWFNAMKFPTITFKSTKLTKTGEKTGKLTGDLTFLGVTKPLTLDVTFNGAYAKAPFSNKPALGFSAVGTLKRSDWGFKTYVPQIGDSVELLLEVEFLKKD